MPDIEFNYLWNLYYVGNGLICQAVAGMAYDTELFRGFAGFMNFMKLSHTGVAGFVAIAAGMEFDDISPGFFGKFHLFNIGIYEKRGLDIVLFENSSKIPDIIKIRPNIKTALGSEFLTLFGNYAAGSRFNRSGDIEHFLRGGDLEIHGQINARLNIIYIKILDVPSVLTKMNGYAITTSLLYKLGSLDN
jgi:hypothetical protein